MMTKQTTKYMDFAGALKALKDGKKVRRESWFNRVSFIYLKTYKNGSYVILVHWNYGEEKDTCWEAGQHDFFAEDWFIVE